MFGAVFEFERANHEWWRENMNRRTKKLIRETLRIECAADLMPGISWLISVEFRPLRRGFSVWLYENNANEKHPRWRKIGGEGRGLTMCGAYAFLRSREDVRVFGGELWRDTKVEGVTEWEGDILRCALVLNEEDKFPRDCFRVGDLLCGFTEKEIQSVLRGQPLDPYAAEEGETPSLFSALDTIAKCVRTLDVGCSTFAEIRALVTAGEGATIEEVAALLVERTEEKKAVKRDNG